jgi:hypothetical protein
MDLEDFAVATRGLTRLLVDPPCLS